MAVRIFRNGAIIVELHEFGDTKDAVACFALSFAMLRSTAHLSSWPRVPHHHARRKSNKRAYGTHGLKQDNLGLCNTHSFVSIAFSPGHIGVILTPMCTSAPKLSSETRFVAMPRGYLEKLSIPVVILKK